MRSDRPSATARLIAAATIIAARDRTIAPLVPPTAADWCGRMLTSSRADRLLRASALLAPGRAFWRGVERATLPGIGLHYQLRKAWLEHAVRRALAEGFGQVVVLGAGLDTLCLRLGAERVHARLVEIDHPATQSIKGRLLEDHPALADAVTLRPHDLATGSIPADAIDPSRPTIVVAEGLLMYLPPPAVARLLAALRNLPCPGLRLALTFMERSPGRPAGFVPGSAMVDAWMKRRREPFLWSIARDDLPGFLRSVGWTLLDSRSAAELRAAAGLTGLTRLEGECVALASAG